MRRCVSHNDVKIPRGRQRPFLLTITCPSEYIFAVGLAPLPEKFSVSRSESRERNTEGIACIPEDWVLCKGKVHANEAPLDVGEYLDGMTDELGVPKSKNEARRDGRFPILVR